MKFVRKDDGQELTEREYYSMILHNMESSWYEQMRDDEKENYDYNFVKFVQHEFKNRVENDTEFDCVEGIVITKNEKIGLNCRYARFKTGISTEDLSKDLKVHGNIVSRFELGKKILGFEHFIRYCEILGVSLDEIVRGDDYKKMLCIQHICTMTRENDRYRSYFASFLKKMREEKKLSVKDAAKLCGVNKNTIQKMEAESIAVSERNLFLLCEFYNVSPDKLERKEL